MTPKVFVSYSSQDEEVASTICSALEKRGLACWIASRDVRPGENFMEAIVRQLEIDQGDGISIFQQRKQF